MTTRPARRPAFTLIELIVVIGILVVLATLAVKFLPNLDRHKGVPNAVAQLHGWVNLAKQQALRDGTPKGIRLIDDGGGRVTSMQYIEQPEPVAPRGPGIKIDMRLMLVYDPLLFPNPNLPYPPNTGPLTVVTLYQDPINTYTGALLLNPPPESMWLNWEGVNPGDCFQLTGSPTGFAGIRRFSYPPQGVPPAPPGPTQPSTAKYAQLVLDRKIDGSELPVGIQSSNNFRVIRQPRPLVGEPMLQMHKDVYIDLTRSHPCPPSGLFAQFFPPPPNGPQATAAWSPNIDPSTGLPYLDILFNSNGSVANAPYGQIMLWVQHGERPLDNLLLTIFTRTGKIAPYTIYDGGGDPYSIARSGQTPGL